VQGIALKIYVVFVDIYIFQSLIADNTFTVVKKLNFVN
jgi:hypothetical protein